jgi:hypothetical protein
MSVIVSHIFRESNHCADKLANIELPISDCIWFDQCLALIKEDFIKNRNWSTLFSIFLDLREGLLSPPFSCNINFLLIYPHLKKINKIVFKDYAN